MVFGAVTSDGCVVHPHVVPAGLRIGTTDYLAILEEVLLPWLEQQYNLEDVVLVRDFVPVHIAQKGQNLLKRRIPSSVPTDNWPPSSPDFNPSDFWLWSMVEEKANSHPYGSVTGLKRVIRHAAVVISPEEARRACARFRSCIEQVRAAEGGQLE